jgi:hypothetical protein
VEVHHSSKQNCKGTRRTAGIGVKSGAYSGAKYKSRQKTVIAASIHSPPLRDFDENALKHWRFLTGSRECDANAGEPCFNALGRDP